LARKILLADDSVTAQNMGRKILADAGYEVIAVNNGSAALKKIAELKPDLVILDVYMPGYSGLEVCQRLKESQETSRIPVLLSVGKLEPFKPEEAHRVRADAFIVKPFEASELLSALSKLEDKVVPRAEPSKPGRFARAIAAQEEASRGGAKEPSGGDNGWKSRIGFPHEKTAEEKVADEPSIYNQMNRDLRTVVDKSPEQAAPLAEFPEATQDAVAPIPPNLLNDVTPEEVAAIAAAVAQMQMATAAQDFAQLVPAVSEEKSEERSEAKPETQISTEPAAAAAPVPAATESEVPATMAVSTESEVAAKDDSPRWKAVSVALDSEEASISLENEMRQAYAAFVAEPEQASTVAVSSEPKPVASPAPASVEQVPSATYSSSSAEPVADSPVALLAPPEPEPSSTFVSSEPATAAMAQSAIEAYTAFPAVAEPEKLPEVANASNEPVTAVSKPAPQESSPIEAHTPEIAVPQVEANHEPALNQESAQVAEQPAPVVAEAIAQAEATPVSHLHEAQPLAEAEPVIAQAAAVGSHVTTGYAQILHRAEHEADPKPESEVVKSTAAAWASWRQTRDNGEAKAESVAESNPSASPSSESVPVDSAAMAVAAGAEHVAQEVSAEPAAEPPAENTEELANIVDSVLADLRPKLMAEISRKMSQKK
jgi:CheY-like chemotaxis protein